MNFFQIKSLVDTEDEMVFMFERNGNIHLLNILLDEKQEDLYIIPTKIWTSMVISTPDSFWEDVAPYHVGTFDTNLPEM